MNEKLLIKKLNKLGETEKRARKRKAKIFLEFLEMGGYIICGYSSFKDFYKDNQAEIPYSLQYFQKLLRIINLELLLDITPGTYATNELKGVTNNSLFPPTFNTKTKTIKSGVRCNIKKRKQSCDRWRSIQDWLGENHPSQKQINLAIKELFDKEIKGYYPKKVRLLEQKIKNLIQENQRLRSLLALNDSSENKETQLCQKE